MNKRFVARELIRLAKQLTELKKEKIVFLEESKNNLNVEIYCETDPETGIKIKCDVRGRVPGLSYDPREKDMEQKSMVLYELELYSKELINAANAVKEMIKFLKKF